MCFNVIVKPRNDDKIQRIADMTVCESPLSRSLSGVKQTWSIAAHMSAFDPKRTPHALPVRWFQPVRSPEKLNGDQLHDEHCRSQQNDPYGREPVYPLEPEGR